MNDINLHKEDDSQQFQLLGQGNTAEIYQYENGKVLKLFRENMPFFPIEIEYTISSIVQYHLQNIPKVYYMVEYRNRYGILYEQITGQEMIQLFVKHPFHIKQYSKQFASIHKKLHDIDLDVHISVKEKLGRGITATGDLTSEEKGRILCYLKTLPDQNQLCHFDFHPGNIILQDGTPIIIDWMTACTGDANADVARTLLLMNMGEIMHIHPMKQKYLHFLMKRIGGLYFKEYQRLTGVSSKEVEQWILPVAAARLSEWLTDHERKELISLVRKKLSHIE